MNTNFEDKRLQLALMLKVDLSQISLAQIAILVGDPPMRRFKNPGYPPMTVVNVDSSEYMQWLAKGLAKWRVMQVDAILQVLEEEYLKEPPLGT
jgi:hypothetical protein